jgi:hypothetical protein
MKPVVDFGKFWYDFVVGDDWTIAIAVVAALIVTYVIALNVGKQIWFLLPVIVALALGRSLWQESRSK